MGLVLNDVSVRLGGQSILNGVNMQVKDGEFVSLLGVSGSGKSTLLQTVAGIIPPSGGSILLGGVSTESMPPHKRGAVIVFQDIRLFPHMNTAENIAFPLKMKGIPRAERMAVSSRLLSRVRLEGFEKRMPHEMSGGQMQRVALARALAAAPNVLLLDEPFSSLDENLRREMRELVRDLHREFSMTTMLVTHDREEALMLSERIALIREGNVLQYDTPKNIFEKPLCPEVAEYFGEAVYLPGRVSDGVFKSAFVHFATDLPDGAYRAMVRPSAVSITGADAAGFKILSAAYQGERYEVLLEKDDPAMRLILRPEDLKGLSPGQRAGLDFDAAKAVLFKNE